jgi:hypothetical protein
MNTQWSLILFSVLLALLPAAPPVRAESKALIVGIDQYQNERIPKLNCCVKDAEAYQNILRDRFAFLSNSLVLLTNENATKERILGALRDLVKDTTPGDSRVFVFAGHGTRVPDKNGDEGKEDGYDEALVPVDARSSSTLIIDDEINELLATARTARWTFFLDCCHSGTATRNLSFDSGIRVRYVSYTTIVGEGSTSSKSLGDEPESGSTGASEFMDPLVTTRDVSGTGVDLSVFAACQPDEKAMEDNSSGHGKFTLHLLKGFDSGQIVAGKSLYADVARYAQVSFEGVESGAALKQNPLVEVPTDMKNLVFIGPSRNQGTPAIQDTPTPSPEGKPPEEVQAPSFTVQVGMEKGSILSEGDTLELWVESEREGFLTLLSWWSDGTVTQIYPNEFHEDNRIHGGTRVSIPGSEEFRLRISPPFGQERIEAIVTERPWKPKGFEKVGYQNAVKSLDSHSAKGIQVESKQASGGGGTISRGELKFETRPKR